VWSCVYVGVREVCIVKRMLREMNEEMEDIIYIRIRKHCRYGCRLRIRSY
jgi:hypothetical protein